jgi:hypothetical protein
VTLYAKIVHVARPRPASLGKITTTHIGESSACNTVGLENFTPKTDVVGVITESGENALVARAEAGGIVADSTSLTGEPPVVLVKLILDGHLELIAAARAVWGESGAGIDDIVVLHPTINIGVISTFVVAVIGVAVGGVIDEQVRDPIRCKE